MFASGDVGAQERERSKRPGDRDIDQRDVEPEQVDGPLSYADDKVLAVDGGLFDGGPCLVVEL